MFSMFSRLAKSVSGNAIERWSPVVIPILLALTKYLLERLANRLSDRS